MSAEIYYPDYKTRTWHKAEAESIEDMGNVIFAQVFPIDGAIPDVFPRFVAPERDGA